MTWKAPDTPGTCMVTVTVDDLDSRAPPGGGSDNDEPQSASLVMQVIRLDKIRLYYGGSSCPPYPFVGSPFSTRAVVWATCTAQYAYCDMGFDEGLTWWTTGNEGPGGANDPPPQSGVFTETVTDSWPSNWPPLTIEWELLHHYGSDPQGYDRKYWYAAESYLGNSWGEDNRQYPQAGLHRLRATVFMHRNNGWEQHLPSLDREQALRICTKDPIIWQAPNPPPSNAAQRQSYLEWLSTYEWEPYEWGGEGYGGLHSEDQYVGGGDAYEGYGMDCSGLVSCGAYRAAYGWSPWRQTTIGLVSVSDPVASPWKDNLVRGDIINKPHHHVVTYLRTTGTKPNRIFDTIEASGYPDNVVLKRTRLETDLDKPCDDHSPPHYYEGRVLK